MILSTGRQRKGPTLWEEELTRTLLPPLAWWRAGRGQWRRAVAAAWPAEALLVPGGQEQHVEQSGLALPVAGSVQTGPSFTVIRSDSVCFELRSGLGTRRLKGL